MTDHDLQTAISELVTVNRRILRTQQWWYLLFHGILVGIGGTVGVALVLTALGALLQRADVVPIIGDWLAQLAPFVQSAIQ